ncbi:hypothetical protein V2J09_012438 [Rumex salicifolius]
MKEVRWFGVAEKEGLMWGSKWKKEKEDGKRGNYCYKGSLLSPTLITFLVNLLIKHWTVKVDYKSEPDDLYRWHAHL